MAEVFPRQEPLDLDVEDITRGMEKTDIPGTVETRRRVTETRGTIYEAVAHLVMSAPGEGVGTGFLVKHGGIFYLVTCAHNIVDAKTGKRSQQISVFFGRSSKQHKPYNCIDVAGDSFTIPEQYEEPRSQDDWAYVNMNQHRKYLPGYWFHVAPVPPKGTTLHLTGFPGYEKPNRPGYPLFSMWTAEFKYGFDKVSNHIYYKDWTQGGNSGSPVYYRDGDRFCVVGIHVGCVLEHINMAVSCGGILPTSVMHLDAKKTEYTAPWPFDVVFTKYGMVVRFSSGACYVISENTDSRTLSGVIAHRLAVTAEGQLAYTCRRDDCVKVVDVDTGTEIRRFGGFDNPLGLAQNTQGQWAVDDQGRGDRHGVVICEQDGREVRRFGSQGDGKMQFKYINFTCWIDNNRLAVSDNGTCRVTVWTKSGELLTTIDSSTTDMFSRPEGLCVTPSSTLLVCELYNHCVNEFTAEGAFIRTLIRPGQDCLHHPTGIHISADGHTMAVCSLSSNAVITYSLKYT